MECCQIFPSKFVDISVYNVPKLIVYKITIFLMKYLPYVRENHQITSKCGQFAVFAQQFNYSIEKDSTNFSVKHTYDDKKTLLAHIEIAFCCYTLCSWNNESFFVS